MKHKKIELDEHQISELLRVAIRLSIELKNGSDVFTVIDLATVKELLRKVIKTEDDLKSQVTRSNYDMTTKRLFDFLYN